MHGDIALAQHADDGLARDPVEEAIGQGRMHLAILDEEDIGTRRLGHIAAIIEHHRVRATLGLGGVLGHGGDHVKTRRFRLIGRGFGSGAAPFGDVELGALGLGIAVVVAPAPRRDGHPHRVALGGHAHIVARAAPCQRAHIGIGQAIGLHHRVFRGLDLVDRIGDRHIDHLARFQQALGMEAALENLAVVSALTLEHRGSVVHRMGQDMDIGPAPIHQLAIHPDLAITIIIGSGHRSASL